MAIMQAAKAAAERKKKKAAEQAAKAKAKKKEDAKKKVRDERKKQKEKAKKKKKNQKSKKESSSTDHSPRSASVSTSLSGSSSSGTSTSSDGSKDKGSGSWASRSVKNAWKKIQALVRNPHTDQEFCAFVSNHQPFDLFNNFSMLMAETTNFKFAPQHREMFQKVIGVIEKKTIDTRDTGVRFMLRELAARFFHVRRVSRDLDLETWLQLARAEKEEASMTVRRGPLIY